MASFVCRFGVVAFLGLNLVGRLPDAALYADERSAEAADFFNSLQKESDGEKK